MNYIHNISRLAEEICFKVKHRFSPTQIITRERYRYIRIQQAKHYSSLQNIYYDI